MKKIHEKLRIAGREVDTERRIDVLYPWDNSVVGSVPIASVEQVREAFESAYHFKPNLTRYQRSEILNKAADLLSKDRDYYATLITRESGLCIKDSTYEIGRVSDVLKFSAHQALVDDGQCFSCDLTPHGKKRRVMTTREPLQGVITAITPFNHPMNQVAHKIAPAIATNNRVVLKPSEKVPLSAYALADVLYEAGLPREMLQVVTGDPKEIADELIQNPRVDLVSFTGGVAIGKYIAEHLGYRRAVLELGGNDPLIVMEDADLERATDLAVAGSYKNSGQRCTAVKRMLVQDSVADEFSRLLVEKTRRMKVGDPLDPETDMGTVIDDKAASYFEEVVADAQHRGAHLLYGNEREGARYIPAILDHVDPSFKVVREETFGPVSPIIRFKDIDEAIRISNSTVYGLSSGVCTDRMDWAMRFVNELVVGTVNIWEVPGYRIELTPFGGIKDSGLGFKEGVQEAMKSFTNIKTFSIPWG